MKVKSKTIKAKSFDEKFDNNENITEYIDIEKGSKKINVDFPIWMLKFLDEEAIRLGINRQAVIKVWISDRIEQMISNRKAAS